MKYTKKEQLNEILLRGEKLRKKKDRNTLRGLSTTAALLFIALVSCIGTFGKSGAPGSRSEYGSFLLSAETGGYILTALLAFLAGVITAVLIQKNKKAKQKNRAE